MIELFDEYATTIVELINNSQFLLRGHHKDVLVTACNVLYDYIYIVYTQ